MMMLTCRRRPSVVARGNAQSLYKEHLQIFFSSLIPNSHYCPPAITTFHSLQESTACSRAERVPAGAHSNVGSYGVLTWDDFPYQGFDSFIFYVLYAVRDVCCSVVRS